MFVGKSSAGYLNLRKVKGKGRDNGPGCLMGEGMGVQRACYIWVSGNLIDISEIEGRGILTVEDQVLDRYGGQRGNGSGE